MQTIAQRNITFAHRNGSSPKAPRRACLMRILHRKTLRRGASFLLVAAAIATFGGCASVPAKNSGPYAQTAHQDITARYLLTAEEKSQDCATLRGRMQISLLQIKSSAHVPQSTTLSRTMKGSLKHIFAGTTHPTDQNLSTAYEIRRLNAYNDWLKYKACQTFDLERELANVSTKNPANTSADGV